MNVKVVQSLIICSFVLVGGCTFTVNRYGASVSNVDKMRNFGEKVSVQEFTSNEAEVSSIPCRSSGSVATPDKETYAKYIYNAFVSELKLAGLYDEAAKSKIKGNFEKIDFSSGVGDGKWFLVLDLSSNSGGTMRVDSTYNFSTNLVGGKGCQQVAQAFVPAVQQLIHEVITRPDFEKLLQ